MRAHPVHQSTTSDLLSLRLRAAIRDVHQRIEATGVARAMADGNVTRSWYGALLAQLIPVHVALEARLDAVGLAGFFDPRLVGRAEALARDQRALATPEAPLRGESRALIAWIQAADRPAMIGFGYVIAGSSMGSQVLRPILARALAVEDRPGAGLDAHRLEPAVLGAAWSETRARLDAPGDASDGIVAGAVTGMGALADLYAAVEDPR